MKFVKLYNDFEEQRYIRLKDITEIKLCWEYQQVSDNKELRGYVIYVEYINFCEGKQIYTSPLNNFPIRFKWLATLYMWLKLNF